MPNQKGSLKDRLRSWNLFLRYKIKKLKQKKELKKQERERKRNVQLLATGKYYSQRKVVGLSILGMFLGLFESRKTKKVTVDSIEHRIDKIQLTLNNNVVNVNIIEDIKYIERELNNEAKVKNPESVAVINRCKEKLERVKSNAANKLMETSKHESFEKRNKLDNDKVSSNKTTIKNTLESNITEESNFKSFNKKVGIYIPTLEIKLFNKDLNKYDNEINKIDKKIKETDNYNNLYEYEFLIKQLKIKIEETIVKYEYLKELPGFKTLEDNINILDIDIYELRKNDKFIKEKLKECDIVLKKIENKKLEIIKSEKKVTTKAKIKKIDKSNERKDKQDKSIEKKEKEQISEILLANKIICDNIINEQRKIAKLERTIDRLSVKQRHQSVFYYTKNFVSSILNLSLIMFPLSLFKNKLLGGLVSGIMLNNSLKSVKKILKPQENVSYIIYSDLERDISSTENYFNKMSIICSDSLVQIEEIRNSLINTYGFDLSYRNSLNEYLHQLSIIENKVLAEQNKINTLNDKLKKINKQKVLKLEVQ